MELLSLPLFILICAALDAFHDPRKLRIGVALLTVTLMTGSSVLAALMGQLPTIPGFEDSELATWILLLLCGMTVVGICVLAGLLIANGVTMVRKEGRALAHMLSLFLGVGILAYVMGGFLAAALSFFNVVAFLLFLAFPLGWIGYGLVAYLFYSAIYGFCVRHFAGPVYAVIVLGAGVPDGVVRPLLAGRISRGLEWVDREDARGRRPLLVMSGGQGPDEPLSEAEAMAKWAQDRGADPQRLFEERTSTTTEENLLHSAKVLSAYGPLGRCAVVTSSYHAFRAALLMRTVGLRGYAIGAPTARYYMPSALLREYAAILRDHKWLNIIVIGLMLLPPVLLAINSLGV